MKGAIPGRSRLQVSLDTTLAVREGINEIVHTLFEALVLVISSSSFSFRVGGPR